MVRVARKRPRSPVRSSPPRAGKKGGEAGGLPTRRSMRNTNSRLNPSEENLAAAAAGTGALPSSASAPVLAQALAPAPKPGPAAMDVDAGPAGGAVAGATPAPAPAAGARAVAAPAGDPPPAAGEGNAKPARLGGLAGAQAHLHGKMHNAAAPSARCQP